MSKLPGGLLLLLDRPIKVSPKPRTHTKYSHAKLMTSAIMARSMITKRPSDLSTDRYWNKLKARGIVLTLSTIMQLVPWSLFAVAAIRNIHSNTSE